MLCCLRAVRSDGTLDDEWYASSMTAAYQQHYTAQAAHAAHAHAQALALAHQQQQQQRSHHQAQYRAQQALALGLNLGHPHGHGLGVGVSMGDRDGDIDLADGGASGPYTPATASTAPSGSPRSSIVPVSISAALSKAFDNGRSAAADPVHRAAATRGA
jgi:hypothetical protein